MLQEIRRRPPKNEKELIEKERNRRAELYQKQMNDRRGSTDILLEVQEQLLKIFSKLKVLKKISVLILPPELKKKRPCKKSNNLTIYLGLSLSIQTKNRWQLMLTGSQHCSIAN